jgi:hypothetical protein
MCNITKVGFYQFLKFRNKSILGHFLYKSSKKKSPDLKVEFEGILTKSFLILHYKTANDYMHLSKMNFFIRNMNLNFLRFLPYFVHTLCTKRVYFFKCNRVDVFSIVVEKSLRCSEVKLVFRLTH